MLGLFYLFMAFFLAAFVPNEGVLILCLLGFSFALMTMYYFKAKKSE
jgi:hypothetical protein